MDVAALVPIKAFGDAKGRLAPVLSAGDRARLARWMAERVVAAARSVTVHVACDDPEVRRWADDLGAEVVWTVGRGLNGAVDDGVAAIGRAGFDHVVVAHADLPLPERLLDVAREGTATFVPDRRRDGTNVMSFPTATPVAASYGPGSYVRHRRSVSTLPIEVRLDPHLSLDVDTPDDLNHPLLREVLPAWLPTIPDNPRR
ncbi:2-phospho-L-lactate guanylyltransferase [Ilumatobacter sp.]|uniref:2-phospho-L-lactate guanylyltransferase n=1 Tax=Ilumatobacter sp. TaxID=1967498 RepID=UPI003B520A8E